VYDQAAMESKMEDYMRYFASDKIKTHVLYASKAFSCKAMIELVKEKGLCLDVVSGGELYTAMQAGFDMNKIYFHGNNKSPMELRMALEAGVKTIVLDNEQEANLLCDLASSFPNQKVHTLLRVNPGVEAHTHKYIQTAYVDSKFGISILKMDDIKGIYKTVSESDNVVFDGFHAHIGSQIFDKNAFVAEIETMAKFIHDFQNQTGAKIKTLDVGGGFAAFYTHEDAPIPLKEVCSTIIETTLAEKEKYGLSLEELLIEPGRSIVAEAGCQLYTIGFSKKTQNKEYVFVDGGMTDNIRPALYEAKYSADVATNMDAPKDHVVTIAGKCCESGDILATDLPLQDYKQNDLLVVYTTGAYGYAMSSNYNKLTTPGVVFVKDGKIRQVVRAQSYADLHALECDEEIQ
jgi:diaminopimelate decarboxylase